LQINPVYVQNSRGKFELVVLSALLQPMLDVRRFAWDLSLFVTAEFGFVELPAAYTTGSSLMPNKRNPDVVELLRASASVVLGAQTEIASILSLPSGYHRDLQGTKGPLVRATRAAGSALPLTLRLVRELGLNAARMRAAITKDMYATDLAIELAREGTPFRDAYRTAARKLDELGTRTPEQSLLARVSPGAAADLRLSDIRARLERARALLAKETLHHASPD
jgi:argininosuccinate lyase